MSFSACFGSNCSRIDLKALLPYVFLIISLIIAPQAGYIYYKSKTISRLQSLKWNIIITVGILILLLIGALLAAPLQSRIRANNRASDLEKVSFDIYISPLATNNDFVYLAENEHTYPHYSSAYKTNEGEIEITGGEFTSDLRNLIGEPPCNLREASSYLTAGSKKRTGLFRKDERVVNCLKVNALTILTATSPYNSKIYYTSYVANGTILIFRTTSVSDNIIFADVADRYISTLELLSHEEVIRLDQNR